jgi:DNA invertase Pin-like site-specific DNA recombinase
LGVEVSEAHVVHEVFTAQFWFERDVLQWLLAEVVTNNIDGFIAFKLDRVVRDQAHLGVLTTTLQRCKGELLLAAEAFDDTPEGKHLMAMKGYQAEQERITTAYRTRIGSEARSESRGLYPGTYKPPLGWKYVEGSKRGKLEHDPAWVPILHRFRDEILSGVSRRKFCAKLTAEGVPTPRGARVWNPRTLRMMLDNPLYVGKPAAFRISQRRRDDDPRRLTTKPRDPSEWVYLPQAAQQFQTDLATWCKTLDGRLDRCTQEQRRWLLQALSVRVWVKRADDTPRLRIRFRLGSDQDFVWVDS